MQQFIYPTASNIAVFLNGVHVDQAYGLQYKESIPKVPIYGYNDYEYTKTVRSKGMVQGMLVLNFVYPGYLSAVLGKRSDAYSSKLYNYNVAQAGESADLQYREGIGAQLSDEMPANTSKESKVARAEFIASLMSKGSSIQKAQTKHALLEFFNLREETTETEVNVFGKKLIKKQYDITSFRSAKSAPKIGDSPNPLTMGTGGTIGNDLDIYYHDPEYAAWFVRLKNVDFTEISQQISQAGSEGSSEPLYHICQFIAKNVEIKKVSE